MVMIALLTKKLWKKSVRRSNFSVAKKYATENALHVHIIQTYSNFINLTSLTPNRNKFNSKLNKTPHTLSLSLQGMPAFTLTQLGDALCEKRMISKHDKAFKFIAPAKSHLAHARLRESQGHLTTKATADQPPYPPLPLLPCNRVHMREMLPHLFLVFPPKRGRDGKLCTYCHFSYAKHFVSAANLIICSILAPSDTVEIGRGVAVLKSVDQFYKVSN